MESKDNSLHKIIRIHLHAQRKAIQIRKLTSTNNKAATTLHPLKNIPKSPDAALPITKSSSQKCFFLASASRLNLPTLGGPSDDYGYCKSSKGGDVP